MPFTPTAEQQAQLLESAARTPEGRMFIAAKVLDPIKQERDFVALGRQGLVMDQLAQGDVPYYDVDIKTRAVVLSGRSEIPQERVNVQRVMVPIFPIASYPLIPIADTKLRKYNVIDRVQSKARADLAEEEDRMIYGDPSNGVWDGDTAQHQYTTYGVQNKNARGGLSAYRAATPAIGENTGAGTNLAAEDVFDHVPNKVVTSNAGLTKDFLIEMFAEVLQHDLLPTTLLVNPREYVDIFSWGRDDIDQETQQEILETGRMGKIWNCEIQMSKIVPKGTAYLRTSDYYLGVMPILIDLDVMDAPDPRGLAFGFAFYEFLGVAILNAWGLCRGRVTRGSY
jgi:hypothetical protein